MAELASGRISVFYSIRRYKMLYHNIIACKRFHTLTWTLVNTFSELLSPTIYLYTNRYQQCGIRNHVTGRVSPLGWMFGAPRKSNNGGISYLSGILQRTCVPQSPESFVLILSTSSENEASGRILIKMAEYRKNRPLHKIPSYSKTQTANCSKLTLQVSLDSCYTTNMNLHL